MQNQNELSREKLNNIILLDPQNFTPLTRTPWAGFEIANTVKASILRDRKIAIGESWEVSCDLEFPSNIFNDCQNLSLTSLISSYPELCLSSEFVKQKGPSLDILVKLINASNPLSLQIHPSDNNKSLKENECGKPESWLILSCEKDAGVFLGFRPDITKDQLATKLKSGQFQKEDLHFVPCSPGDFFEIEPGMPHAVGSGLTIFEPQRIQTGRKGVTWRMWDWNRTYDSNGQEAPDGSPRALHIDQSLELLSEQSKLNGNQLHKAASRKPETVTLSNGVKVNYYPENNWYQVTSVFLDVGLSIAIDRKFLNGSITCLAGGLDSKSKSHQLVSLPQGFSGFIPNSSLSLELTATKDSTHVVFVRSTTTATKDVRFVSSVPNIK